MRYALLLSLALLTACGAQGTVYVEADTNWSGSIAGVSYDGGPGQSYIRLKGYGVTCWAVQKQTRAGTLTVYAKIDRGITGTETQGKATTSAAFGVVTGCADI